MNRQDLIMGRWGPYLEHALLIKPCFNGPLNGGKVSGTPLQTHLKFQTFCRITSRDPLISIHIKKTKILRVVEMHLKLQCCADV